MAKIVSIHSFRGGTGKSNLTANLAVLAARAGRRVGVVDTDIHSPGIHVVFAVEQSAVKFALNDFLWGRCRIEEAAHPISAGWRTAEDPPGNDGAIYLIPSSVKTGEIARILREGYDVARLTDGFRSLIRELALDFLFIDTHPGVNEETLLSIALSDTLLLVMRPDSQDFQGTAVTIELARRLEVNEMRIVINKTPPGVDEASLRAQVEAAFRVPVVEVLPLAHDMARLGSSGVFVTRYPAHPLSQGLVRVAEGLLSR
jgi:MinD-like ATPase involved in chromosome partitioning or flagellar assembly